MTEGCDDAECPICLDKLQLVKNEGPTGLYVSACNHTFHDACIQKLFSTGVHKCPLCRAQWKTSNVDNDGDENENDENEDYYEIIERHRREIREAELERLEPSRVVAREERARERREAELAELTLSVDPSRPSRVASGSEVRTHNLRSFATNYNYLRIMSGLGGLHYTG